MRPKANPIQNKLVAITDTRSAATEEFRVLRTNLQFMGVEKKIRRLLVTSTQPGEGKTTVSANLGVVLSQAGSKVLIVDCDLRRPSLHTKFNEKLTPGVTNYFTGEDASPSRYIKKTEVEGLHIITSGAVPPNPSELLASARMKNFLNEVENDYDYVIIDSPPAGGFADAAMLSKLCDGVLFICASGQAKKEHIKKTVDSFEKINSKVIGVVVNKISKKTLRYEYGYASYYQSYYHEDTKSK
jgi:capsular exopolysaccharide synthesis family protein